MKKIVVIGNGIIALMTALRLRKKDKNIEIIVIGPNEREGCASLAAPAMLNSYAELTKGSLDSKLSREKFKISRLAGKQWKYIFDDLEEYKVKKPSVNFGTYVVNNTTMDSLDDDNFNAIIEYLEEFGEEYELVYPKKIIGYQPADRQRALRAVFMKNEGFVNSKSVISFLEDYLKNNNVEFINAKARRLIKKNETIVSIELDDGNSITGDSFLLAPGANFSKIIDASDLNLTLQRVLYGSGVTIEIKPREKTIENCVRTPNRGMACGIYSAPRTENTIVIGASNLIADYGLENGMLTSVETLVKASMEEINTSFYNAGFVGTIVGWRPTSEDTYPLIGKTKLKNLIIATGTKRDGFHMSPIISEYLTSLFFEESYENSHLFLNFFPERELIRNISREQAINDIVDHQISAMYQHDFVAPKSNMLNDYKEKLRLEAIEVHDRNGAMDWGIPPELYGMYKAGYLSCENTN